MQSSCIISVQGGISYCNSLSCTDIPPKKQKSAEPVSYWCYKVTKKDEWIAMLGCISDWFIPDFAEEFAEKYKDIFSLKKNPDDILFDTEFGRLIRIISFALKDTTSNVIRMMKVLWNAKDPYEILHEGKSFEKIQERYKQIKKKYDLLIEKAKTKAEREKDKKFFYFEYRSDMGMSSELSNELLYSFREKEVLMIVRIKDNVCKISIRGRGHKDMRKLVAKALEGTHGKGGGHEHACGVTINLDEVQKFKKNFKDLLK